MFSLACDDLTDIKINTKAGTNVKILLITIRTLAIVISKSYDNVRT